MTKVYIDMDEGFQFYPVYVGSVHYCDWMMRKPFKLEIDQALLDEYVTAQRAYRAVHEKMEQLYRVQEGLEPWQDPAVPEHKVLP